MVVARPKEVHEQGALTFTNQSDEKTIEEFRECYQQETEDDELVPKKRKTEG